MEEIKNQRLRTALISSTVEMIVYLSTTEAGDHALFIGKPLNIKERKKGRRIVQTEEELFVFS
jgi:hypothetical protein